jgi:hypothetical protein
MHTRHAMSYLRGPMTREELKRLNATMKPAAMPSHSTASVAAGAANASPGHPVSATPVAARTLETSAGGAPSTSRPLVPGDVTERFAARVRDQDDARVYRPALLGRVRLHFVDAKRGVDAWHIVTLLGTITGDGDPWDGATRLDVEPALDDQPAEGFAFADIPASALRTQSYRTWQRALADRAYREEIHELFECRALDRVSEPGETEGRFRIRLTQHAREQRDTAIEKLRQKYAPKLSRIEQRIRTSEERVARERAQYDQQKRQTAISLGASVLGAVFGRKLASVGNIGRATTAARGATRVGREREDVARAQETVESVMAQKGELERELESETVRLQSAFDPTSIELARVEIRPRKTDIASAPPVLVWLPFGAGEDGLPRPLY